MEYIDKGHTTKDAHELFGVGTTTIKAWKNLRKETGALDKRPLKRKSRKICLEQLQAHITENPDSYQNEMAELFDCTQPAVHYALKRLKMTRKKNG